MLVCVMIGMADIPDELINKNKLSDEEYDIFKTYVDKGYEIVGMLRTSSAESIAEAVHYHRENYDGSGENGNNTGNNAGDQNGDSILDDAVDDVTDGVDDVTDDITNGVDDAADDLTQENGVQNKMQNNE